MKKMKTGLWAVAVAAFASSSFAIENNEILNGLGAPVQYTHSNPAYQPEAMKMAFSKACEEYGFKLRVLKVDESEYPPLLYGKISEGQIYPAITNICEQMGSEYSHNGTATENGSFGVNIIPNRAHPEELRGNISKRLMARLTVLRDRVAKELNAAPGEDVRTNVAIYEVNKSVADFPLEEDFSTPESAYAAINRIMASGGSASDWSRISGRELGSGTSRPSAQESKMWREAIIREVNVYKGRVARVFAEVQTPLGEVMYDQRSVYLKGGLWFNQGQDPLVRTVTEARATFESKKDRLLPSGSNSKRPSAQVAVLLEQGIYTEETVGNLKQAIEIYRQIVEDDQANRKYVAEALFRMGRCCVAQGDRETALAALTRFVQRYPEQKTLIRKANDLIEQLMPKPIFPDLEICRLNYPISLHLTDEKKAEKEYTLYQTDLIELTWEVEFEENHRSFFCVELVPSPGTNLKKINLPFYEQLDPSERSAPAFPLDEIMPGKYILRVSAKSKEDGNLKGEVILNVKEAMNTQLGVNDIQLNGDIQFTSVQQTPIRQEEIKQRGFINSDFVHIESMFDGQGADVTCTEKHEGNHFRYSATLNKPVLPGETLFLGSKGWSESLISKGDKNEYRYRMNHTPGGNEPTRRVEIFRLPHGAELLSTTPTDLPHRVLEDGRVELLVDTIIPLGGSLLTEFRYRISSDSDKYVAEIAALKKTVSTMDKRRALERIEDITAKAEFHKGALVELAKLVPEAEYNQQCILHAAELVSRFGYHTGALLEVAKIGATTDHECKELRTILDQIVLNLGGTPLILQLARDAAAAKSDEEIKSIQARLEKLQATADYLTLQEALKGQKKLFQKDEATSRSSKEELQICVRQFFQSNWRDVKDREDVEWGPVQQHGNGNRSIRYRYKARIWDGKMQMFEDTFTFNADGKYVSVEQTDGYPWLLDEQ